MTPADHARRMLEQRWVEPLVSTALLARLTRSPVRFALAELLAPGRLVAHRVDSLEVLLEHGSPDVDAFDELFYQRIYEPPVEVEEALAALGRAPRILDVGANIGLFGAWALTRWPAAKIDAYEPDPRNAAVHRAVIRRNVRAGSWRLHEAAAAARAGTLPFAAGQYATGGVTERGAPGAIDVRAVDVLPEVQRCDLLKLDAEGGEWEILGDARFAATSARAVALEYHPDRCPEPDARAAAFARLKAAGFRVRDVATAAPPGYGSVWAWRDDPASRST